MSENFEMSDISHWRVILDHDQIPLDRAYYIKATEGETFTDPEFFVNWENFKNSGHPRGAFHFMLSRSNLQLAKRQAEKFWREVESTGDPGELELAYDFEKPWSIVELLEPEKMQEFIITFLYRLHGLSGQWASTYTNLGTWDQYVANAGSGPSAIPNISELWVANWYVAKPKLPWDWVIQKGEDSWLWWQDGRFVVPGIKGLTDHNQFNGHLAAFNERYDLEFKPGEPLPPPPPPPDEVERVRIVGLDGDDRLNMRDGIWGPVVCSTWNGSEFDVMDIGQDPQDRRWYQLGKSIWIAGWYAEAVE